MPEADIEKVYHVIFDFLVTYDRVPKLDQVAFGANMSIERTRAAIKILRKEGRVRQGILYPVVYDSYWREHIRTPEDERHQLTPIPRQKYRVRRRQAG